MAAVAAWGSSFLPGAGLQRYQLPFASVNAQVQQRFGLSGGFGAVLTYVGVECSAYNLIVNEIERHASAYAGVYFALPQTISNDSIHMTLNSWQMQFDGFSFGFIQGGRVNLIAGLAWSWGNAYIRAQSADTIVKYENPFFAPMLRSELSVKPGKRLVTGVRAAYRHDISKTGWRKYGAGFVQLPGTRLSGGSVGLFFAIDF
jgi:hypothetical protein